MGKLATHANHATHANPAAHHGPPDTPMVAHPVPAAHAAPVHAETHAAPVHAETHAAPAHAASAHAQHDQHATMHTSAHMKGVAMKAAKHEAVNEFFVNTTVGHGLERNTSKTKAGAKHKASHVREEHHAKGGAAPTAHKAVGHAKALEEHHAEGAVVPTASNAAGHAKGAAHAKAAVHAEAHTRTAHEVNAKVHHLEAHSEAHSTSHLTSTAKAAAHKAAAHKAAEQAKAKLEGKPVHHLEETHAAKAAKTTKPNAHAMAPKEHVLPAGHKKAAAKKHGREPVSLQPGGAMEAEEMTGNMHEVTASKKAIAHHMSKPALPAAASGAPTHRVVHLRAERPAPKSVIRTRNNGTHPNKTNTSTHHNTTAHHVNVKGHPAPAVHHTAKTATTHTTPHKSLESHHTSTTTAHKAAKAAKAATKVTAAHVQTAATAKAKGSHVESHNADAAKPKPTTLSSKFLHNTTTEQPRATINTPKHTKATHDAEEDGGSFDMHAQLNGDVADDDDDDEAGVIAGPDDAEAYDEEDTLIDPKVASMKKGTTLGKSVTVPEHVSNGPATKPFLSDKPSEVRASLPQIGSGELLSDFPVDPGHSIRPCQQDMNHPCVLSVDSGHSLISGPPELIRTIKQHTMPDGGCTEEETASLPDVSFVIGGKMFTLTPMDYLIELDGKCTPAFRERPFRNGHDWVLGEHFMRTFYTVFDYDDMRIGMARLDNIKDHLDTILTPHAA